MIKSFVSTPWKKEVEEDKAIFYAPGSLSLEMKLQKATVSLNLISNSKKIFNLMKPESYKLPLYMDIHSYKVPTPPMDIPILTEIGFNKGIKKDDLLEEIKFYNEFLFTYIDPENEIKKIFKSLDNKTEEKKAIPPKGRSQKSHDLILKMNKKKFS